jgi:peroxiredoxin
VKAPESEPGITEEPPDEPAYEGEEWSTPPFQLGRALAALALTALGFGLYEYVLVSFWSSPSLGIYDRIPWPAYAIFAAALILALAAVRVAFGMYSPHAKLGFGMLAFLACVAIGVSGGRFVSYTMRGTRNPPFALGVHPGDKFPSFSLLDQNGKSVEGPAVGGAGATLIYIYRGDFCPFSRYALATLTKMQPEFESARVATLAVSADPIERSKYLSGYLRTSIPLLSDSSESILKPLGLVQTHRDGEPDSAIPCDGSTPPSIIASCQDQMICLPPRAQLLAAVQRQQHRSSRGRRRIAHEDRSNSRNARGTFGFIICRIELGDPFAGDSAEGEDWNLRGAARGPQPIRAPGGRDRRFG